MTDENRLRFNLTPMVQHVEAILKQNKHIQNDGLEDRLPHVLAFTNLC